MASSDKKDLQLGMKAGTAAHKLRTAIMFEFIKRGGYKCHRCDGELTKETFSIEHKEEWLDSVDPVGKFFDLNNIAFSHRSCNYAAARRTTHKHRTQAEKRIKWAAEKRESYDPLKRRAKFDLTGH